MALTAPGQPSDNRANDFAGASQPNIIGYRFLDLDPGANIYIQRDDKLVIQTISSQGTIEVLNVNIRLLQPGHPSGRTQPDASTIDNPLGDSRSGVIVPINVMIPIPTSFVNLSRVIDLAEGYLMSVAISATAATQRGVTFVRAFILRGSANVANVAYLLAADYVTTQTAVGWPFGDVRQSTDGQGVLFQLAGTPVGAGVDFVYNISTPSKGLLLSLQATLTTSAAVANRIVTGRLTIGGQDSGTFPASQAIPASTVAKVTFAPGAAGNALTPTIVNVQLPQLVYMQESSLATFRLATTTLNLQGADQWSNIWASFMSWFDI